MNKVIKEYYYEENEIAEKIKELKKKLNESDLQAPKVLELSRELDRLIVLYMKGQWQAKQEWVLSALYFYVKKFKLFKIHDDIYSSRKELVHKG